MKHSKAKIAKLITLLWDDDEVYSFFLEKKGIGAHTLVRAGEILKEALEKNQETDI